MIEESSATLSTLRQLIDQHFNLDEIHELCTDLGIDYEHLRGETKPPKIEALLSHCQRHGRLPDLIQ